MKIREDLTERLSSWYFRLEFHEEKQQWYYEKYNSTREENTFGWYTIIWGASQLEIEAFLMFIQSQPKGHLITVKYLIKKRDEWIRFYNELVKNNWAILPIERKIK